MSKTLKLFQGTDKSILVNSQQSLCPEPTVVQACDEEEISELDKDISELDEKILDLDEKILNLDSFCSKMNNNVYKQIKVISAADAARNRTMNWVHQPAIICLTQSLNSTLTCLLPESAVLERIAEKKQLTD